MPKEGLKRLAREYMEAQERWEEAFNRLDFGDMEAVEKNQKLFGEIGKYRKRYYDAFANWFKQEKENQEIWNEIFQSPLHQQLIDKAFFDLTPREQVILMARDGYIHAGLSSAQRDIRLKSGYYKPGTKRPIKEVAAEFGISESWTRQYINRAKNRITYKVWGELKRIAHSAPK